MIESLSHITFIVKDIEKTSHFLRSVFDAKEVYNGSIKNYSISYEKFFMIGDIWVAIMEGESLAERSYNHVAFKIHETEFEDYELRIEKLGLEVKSGRDRQAGEARSIYFYDYDNHLFELHTGTLWERLSVYNT